MTNRENFAATEADRPYDPAEFARKWKINISTAEAILDAYSSAEACDDLAANMTTPRNDRGIWPPHA